jgi:hypothetical protein
VGVLEAFHLALCHWLTKPMKQLVHDDAGRVALHSTASLLTEVRRRSDAQTKV